MKRLLEAYVAIALPLLAENEEALRYDQVQIVLRTGHGDVQQQAALFLDLRRGADTEVRRHAAIDGVKELSGTGMKHIVSMAPSRASYSISNAVTIKTPDGPSPFSRSAKYAMGIHYPAACSKH